MVEFYDFKGKLPKNWHKCQVFPKSKTLNALIFNNNMYERLSRTQVNSNLLELSKLGNTFKLNIEGIHVKDASGSLCQSIGFTVN